MTRESIFDENGELAASFCPTDVPLSDKGREALDAVVRAVRKDMAAKPQQLDLGAVEHRSDRFMARLAGKQEGSTPIAAQQSALDVPDLLAALKDARAEVERLRVEVTRFTVGGEGEHPELRCNRCGRQNVSWSAPSPLWNQVMRDGDINKVPELFAGIICPACFAALAEEAGIARRWQFYAEVVNVPLSTVTPSGRVWNPETWLWDEPSGNAPVESAPAAHVAECEGGHTREISCAEVTKARDEAVADLWWCRVSGAYHMWDVPTPQRTPEAVCAHGCGQVWSELAADLAAAEGTGTPEVDRG